MATDMTAITFGEEIRSTPTALELCLYFHTKDHDDVTFLDQRVETIVRDDKGRTYELEWTPSGSRRRHAGAGSSRPMSTSDEPIEQLREKIKEMQRSLLRVINDKTLDRDQLFEMHGRLGRIEQALMDRFGISFAPPTDPIDDSEIDQDPDD
ncbi:hypothetical protein Scep_016247 [Stephania cephalantha]|uniref:Uncharacterized protein n=1 Tax=Stephania cephalantha TaxID=152367 RepID=A0AAP0IM95_9MAGN